MHKALCIGAQLSGRQAKTTCCSVPHTSWQCICDVCHCLFYNLPSSPHMHYSLAMQPKPCWGLCQASLCTVYDILIVTCSPLLQIKRDKNHPSIIAWSCGNESGFGKAHTDMAKFYRQLDPYRPTHYEVRWSVSSCLCKQQPVFALLCLLVGVSCS